VLSVVLILFQDHREGRSHAWYEYGTAVTLPIYFGLEGVAIVVAFLDEFVFRQPIVYVTSTRPTDGSTEP
jgi:hypothetical protein